MCTEESSRLFTKVADDVRGIELEAGNVSMVNRVKVLHQSVPVRSGAGYSVDNSRVPSLCTILLWLRRSASIYPNQELPDTSEYG